MIGDFYFDRKGFCYVVVNDGGTVERLRRIGFFRQLKMAIRHCVKPYTLAEVREEVIR